MIKIPITNPTSHPSMSVSESIERDRIDRLGREDRIDREGGISVISLYDASCPEKIAGSPS